MDAPTLRDRFALVDQIACFIATYREAGELAAKTQEAVLAAFPQADADDYVRGLCEANRRRRADCGNG